ncbi:hypothetical protein GQ607_004590 [Colletotrichum asianum]|uniref:Uncharacterized protein n=1 Tax=Colletotrichum asianum TaxID=702518 RepID=A0A8H3WKZ6_9PEZI|nr:hypothetical protein GQ607_004590 [Colletotrichum asianum]
MFACLPVNNSPANFGSAYGKVSRRRPQFDKIPMIDRDHRLIQKATGNFFTTRDCFVCPHRVWSRLLLSIALQRTVGKVAISLYSERHGTQEKRNSSAKSKCQVCQLGTPSKSATPGTYHNRKPSRMSATSSRFSILSYRPHRLLQLASELPLQPCNATHNESVLHSKG